MASESHGYKTAICQATGEGKGGERYDSVGLGIKLRNSTQQFLHCLSSKQSQSQPITREAVSIHADSNRMFCRIQAVIHY